MTLVQYNGPSDTRIFYAKDFKKAEVESTKMVFPKSVGVEVSDEVAAALLSSEGIFGDENFSEVGEEDSGQSELEF